MGAIAGIVYPDIYQVTDCIVPMMRALERRSRGARFTHSWRNIQLGAFKNPIGFNSRHTIAAALDGHIANGPALRKHLKEIGHSPQHFTDAELIVCAYECWELDFLKHIDGEFALVIIDESNAQTILARDRIGKKPLYWYHDAKHFIFASELNPLLATGMVPQTPAEDGLAAYLSLGYIPQDVTPILGVNKLLPAHALVFGPGRRCYVSSYWSYGSHFDNPRERPQKEVTGHLQELIQTSIAQHIQPKQPIGCFVSGGLGSAGIAYFTKKLAGPDQVVAYSAGFDEYNTADLSAASNVCQALALPHESSLTTQTNFLDDIVRVVWHLGEPIADPNILSTWHLAELAATQTQQVLSGMGSDELLAGHMRYTKEGLGESYEPWFHKIIQPLQRAIAVPILKYLNPGAALEILRNSRTNPWQALYLEKNALFNRSQLAQAAPPLADLFNLDTFLQKFYRLDHIHSLVASYLYFDVKTRLPECFILQYDRLTTAFDLGWAAPYLSTSIVEYLAGIAEPDSIEAKETAVYLKAILRSHLPDSVLDRPKEKRPHFLETWADSPVLTEAFHLLVNGTCVDTGLISKKWLLRQLDTPSSKRHAFRYLWAVLILEIWYRLFVSSPISFEPPDISLIELLSE